jgi:hypothetical protein
LETLYKRIKMKDKTQKELDRLFSKSLSMCRSRLDE